MTCLLGFQLPPPPSRVLFEKGLDLNFETVQIQSKINGSISFLRPWVHLDVAMYASWTLGPVCQVLVAPWTRPGGSGSMPESTPGPIPSTHPSGPDP